MLGVLATVAIALLAGATWRDSRRAARIRYVTERLENLYSPLQEAAEEAEGRVLVWVRSGYRPDGYDLWEDCIVPALSQYYHLASPDLQTIFVRLRRALVAEREEEHPNRDANLDALEREFVSRIRVEYDELVKELHRLVGHKQVPVPRGNP